GQRVEAELLLALHMRSVCAGAALASPFGRVLRRTRTRARSAAENLHEGFGGQVPQLQGAAEHVRERISNTRPSARRGRRGRWGAWAPKHRGGFFGRAPRSGRGTSRKGQPARRDRRGLDDRRGRLAVGKELVEDRLQLVDR